MKVDVAIAGGGPAGLALAIHAAKRGLSTIVLERRTWPVDKACGEGLMPAGLGQLESMGVLGRVSSADSAPFESIRYVQEDGSFAEARLPGRGGLGIRRVALVEALAARARELGAQLRSQSPVLRCWPTSSAMVVETPFSTFEATLLVAADGLMSPLRRAAGLERASPGPRRFGLRQHFRLAPWSRAVEIHLSTGAEAYVTPAGAERVGVAFLWEEGRATKPVSVQSLLHRFPALEHRLKGVDPDSSARGVGPLAQAARELISERFALLGDAAGYVDAITGEGLSLAFVAAATLGELLPAALKQEATRQALVPYERECIRRFRHYSLVARSVLALARRPALRRRLVHHLSVHPRLFERLVAWCSL